MRLDNREWDEMRPVNITKSFLKSSPGSILIEMGNTKVICSATLEEGVPPFLRNSGQGWLTAEYSMLPASTHTRTPRESARGRVSGRTHEIQRLIGRSLRSVVDLTAFGERTVYIDCDVIQADGGTRTASITGAIVALAEAFRLLKEDGFIDVFPIKDFISAISVGIVDGEILLDLDYSEDSRAEVDMNFVVTGGGEIVEIQGTAEGTPFNREQLNKMTDIAFQGTALLTRKQIEVLGKLT